MIYIIINIALWILTGALSPIGLIGKNLSKPIGKWSVYLFYGLTFSLIAQVIYFMLDNS